jgi:hypothetical protein
LPKDLAIFVKDPWLTVCGRRDRDGNAPDYVWFERTFGRVLACLPLVARDQSQGLACLTRARHSQDRSAEAGRAELTPEREANMGRRG